MHLATGTRLGVYEIRSLLGAGGMGEVYRARDSKLNRDVAIKVLSGAYATDPERLSRFHREAQLLASLNHPYIAQIYGFEDFHSVGQPAVSALVLELVEGQSLAERIAQGAVPLEEALPIARQVATALAAAHERGIIHRDLKPANIMLTAAGTAKVLDFGIAKALAVHPGPGDAGVSSSTFDSPRFAPTTVGVVLGTVGTCHRSRRAASRSTSVPTSGPSASSLYEMLTGHRPFEGETVSDTVAAVLRGEIDWTRLPADTPDELQRLLRRCLERDPENRLQDAGDVRLVLSELERGVPAVTSGRGSPARWEPWLAAGSRRPRGRGRGRPRSGRSSSRCPAGRPPFPVQSSDSRLNRRPASATSRTSRLRLTVDSPSTKGESTASHDCSCAGWTRSNRGSLTGTEGARWPFVSPDGTWIGFFRDAKIYKVSTNGGDPLVVCDVRGGPGAAWTGDGRIVFSRTWLSGLSVVSEDGGQPTVLTTPDPAQQEIGHWWPSMLPDGHILFTVVTAGTGLNDARIALLDPEDGSYRVLFPGARASWMASGHLVFYRTGRYQAVPFDLSTLQVAGESFPVLEDAQELDPSGDWPQPVATAPGGALAYLAGPYVPPSRLTWIDAAGTRTALAFAERPFVSVKLSPDGRRAAAASLEGGRLLIRLFDLDRGTEEYPRSRA